MPIRWPALHVRKLLFLLAIVTALALAVALVRPFYSPLGHDQAWGLYLGRLWLAGAPIGGPTLVDLDSPVRVGFMALPVLLGRMLHVPVLLAGRLFFDLVFLLFAAVTIAAARRVLRQDDLRMWAVALGTILGFMLLLPPEDVGSLHLLSALMLLPYLLTGLHRGRREALPPALGVLTGLAAVLALCLKPQNVVLLLALELAILLRLRRRWLSPAPVTLLLGTSFSLAAVWFGARSYFLQVLPAARFTAGIGSLAPFDLHAHLLAPALLLAALLLAATTAGSGRSKAAWQLQALLAIAALCSGISGVLGRFSASDVAPTAAFATLSLALGLVEQVASLTRPDPPALQDREAGGPARVMPAFIAVLIAGLLMVPFTLKPQGYTFGRAQKRTLSGILAPYPPHTAVALLSEGPWAFPAVVEQNKVWGSRFLDSWWLPGVIRQEESTVAPPRSIPQRSGPSRSAEAHALAARFTRAWGEDLQRWHPAVFVYQPFAPSTEAAARAQGYADVLAWMQQDPLFQAEWQHYTPAGTRDGMRIYTRKP